MLTNVGRSAPPTPAGTQRGWPETQSRLTGVLGHLGSGFWTTRFSIQHLEQRDMTFEGDRFSSSLVRIPNDFSSLNVSAIKKNYFGISCTTPECDWKTFLVLNRVCAYVCAHTRSLQFGLAKWSLMPLFNKITDFEPFSLAVMFAPQGSCGKDVWRHLWCLQLGKGVPRASCG